MSSTKQQARRAGLLYLLGYLAGSFTSLLLPRFASLGNQIEMVLGFGEVPLLLWLLIWGAREPSPVAAAAAAG